MGFFSKIKRSFTGNPLNVFDDEPSRVDKENARLSKEEASANAKRALDMQQQEIDQAEAARQQVIIQQQADRDQAKLLSEQNARQKALDDAADQRRFDVDLEDAYSLSQRQIVDNILERGLDPNDFTSAIRDTLMRQRRNIPNRSTGVFNLFDSNNAANILNARETNTRSRYGTEVSKLFPTGFAEGLISNESDDATIEAILQEQGQPAQATIQRALARGMLSDRGFNAANTVFQGQQESARAKLSDLGANLLSTGRGDLRSIAEEASTGASGYRLGTDFSSSAYKDRADVSAQDFLANIGGKLRGALGGENLFDTGSLIQRGGQTAGTTNTRGNLFDVLAKKKKDDDSTQRGLGTQGAF